ncbi:glycosyltransferase family 4 protein [Gelidibacter salicanalis]|uniref:Glycosyltransferase family 4 protein n=1 Tax=Gelidibacter salicanalis TaxID=291193 RepID=A0A5C7ANY1_9FLAO|nr:glycosyltransferase family 4 protein [Gelidibacter salicanalis]TXE09283.1 glycosyltransferase family 4 protein [Gelidibacter salicanalis]
MQTVLIIYPHWVPANMAGVQRPRLIGNYLKQFGWHPLLLTVDSKYYEETPDPLMEKTVSDDIEVIYTKAYNVTKPRLIGDIGLRAFPFLKKEALRLCKERQIDFIWIPIPSFYTALLGRIIHDKTGIPYGIDYIDPWVRDITNQSDVRAKLSQAVARTLEPYAVKKAALITGVSTPYYQPVIDRNFKTPPIHAGMPYGFDPKDHEIELEGLKLPWDDQPTCRPWLYAGAFLPNSHLFVQSFFEAVAALKLEGNWDKNIRLYFVGTGPYPAKRITAYAKDYGLEDIVVEHRERFPFLHILNFLSKADRVMLFGSTEKHYTASKTFQCLLSKRPLLSMLHAESSAVDVIREANADAFLMPFHEGDKKGAIVSQLKPLLNHLQDEVNWNLNLNHIDAYTSRQSAKVLAEAMDEVLRK